MKREMDKRITTICLILCLLLLCGCQEISADYEKPLAETGKNLYSIVTDPVPGSIGGEWAVIGLARGDFTAEDGYFDSYVKNVGSYVKKCGGVLHTRTGYKYTEYSRIILGLTAVKADVKNVSGYNLLEKLTDMKDVCRQGINGPIWALIAYDSGSYQIPVKRNDETQTTRQRLIEAILDGQLSDGGWDIASSSGDADMTGMALQALAPYYLKTADKIDEVDQAVLDRVKSAVDKGLTLISSIQEGDGGFSSMGGRSSESCCQIIVALSSLRIDLKTDKRFIKEGHTVLDALLSYYDGNGGFYHTDGEDEINCMATEQAYYAMTAYDRFVKGESPVYDMN